MKRRKDGLYQQELPRDITGGKRKVVYGKTKAEVLRKIADYTEKAESGQTFAAVAAEWWEDAGPKLAASTHKGYVPAMNRAVEALGSFSIKELRPKDISAFINRAVKAHRMADKTARTQLMVINLICRYAVQMGYADLNPARELVVPKGLDKVARDMASAEDIATIKASYDLPFGDFAYWALYTGLRRGELRALTWDDVDTENRTITVNKSLSIVGGRREAVKAPKTQAGIRVVPILDKLLERVEKGNGPVFKNFRGEAYTDAQCQSAWAKYKELTGVTCTPHQLRHSYTVMLFEAGVSDSDAQELLGHAQIQTTKDVYTHLRDAHKAKVREGLYSIDIQ